LTSYGNEPMMSRSGRTIREKKVDWMITWQDNPVRWVIFYYILGLIFSCLFAFAQEALLPLPVPYLYKGLIVTVLVPCFTVAASIGREVCRERKRPTPVP